MIKWIVILVILLALAGGGGWWWYSKTAQAAATPPAATAKVERGTLRIVVASNGRVVSAQDVPIKCKASGKVISLPFDVSDRVKKDDILLQLDHEDQDPAVAKAKAVLAASVAQLEFARQDLLVSRQALVTSRLKAEASLLTAQVKQQDAHHKADRVQALLEKKLASPEDFETAATTATAADADLKTAESEIEDLKTQELALGLKEQTIKVQQANVDQNKVDLDIQEQQLSYATVRSPIDGIVTSLISGKDAATNDIITRIGTIVQSGTSSVSGGTTVMTVSDHSHIYVYATVDESDIGQVEDPQLNPGKPGQRVTITADSWPGKTFDGHVVCVADGGVLGSNVVTFEVRIEVDSANRDLLKPQMTANVQIIKAEHSDVLLIPQAAFVRTKPAEPAAPATAADPPPAGPKHPRPAAEPQRPLQGTVTVLAPDGATQERPVTVGLTDTTNYEVLSGLELGETVLLHKGAGDSKWRGPNGGH